jgi:hypothetical protein
MNSRFLCTAFLVLGAASAAPVPAAHIISNVAETGGDAEPTDTITAKWTGQTFQTTVANEPLPNTQVGTNFTVPSFGNLAPAYVDRNHRYAHHTVDTVDPLPTPPDFQIPAYLIGGDYIMSGNDNRDNNPGYRLDVTVNQAVTAYMLIDNRMGDDANGDPPTFGANSMQWILDQGWLPTVNGLNRTANPAVPDEVPIDEGANNDINQWFSVYRKDFPAGTFSLLQPDNADRNMYGVVVVPEPSGVALGCAAGLALLKRRRSSLR